MSAHNRIEVLHGVNLDQLGRRDRAHYGDLSFDTLQFRIEQYAVELGLTPRFFQTNYEGAFVEHLHTLDAAVTDGIVLNPGAWTHYAWAIRDALELTGVPAVEVHLSDVDNREDFRRISVVRDVCLAAVKGEGVEGYRTALTRLKEHLHANPR
jgi:3-dehydroquinate dehydratase II